MRKYFLLALIVLAASLASAQTARSVTLTWQDTGNPAGTTYNVYRSTVDTSGNCSIFQTLVSTLSVKTYTDAAVKTGETWCYEATANVSGLESQPSNVAKATVKPFPPTNMAATSN